MLGVFPSIRIISAFEQDLFGKKRSLSHAEFETYLATEEAAKTTRITLIADTATAWVTLAADQNQLALAEVTLKVRSQPVTLHSFV
ncbi:outer membrane protein%2C efflux pump [Yersinia aleksiciae]|uniref:Outer membrane protein, efflux pump n=1 Tax=Yersinia aleksiciae TaxID=263819 RepID=A0A0T9T2A5_YERAE|nr:outer membrane protein%2C efflux pump [Yersinia aleksiciae]